MATPNRSALINRTIKVLRKHFKPVPPPKDRTLFEHLLFACLVEDSPQESAEQVFNTLKQDYFGWNEVRVSTIRELTDVLKPLVNPPESAETRSSTAPLDRLLSPGAMGSNGATPTTLPVPVIQSGLRVELGQAGSSSPDLRK